MGRLLGFALAQQRYDEAQDLMQPLNEFWDARGLRQEARGWVDRIRAVLEDGQGTPPELDSAAGALWLFAVGSEANRAILAGDLDAATATYDAIRQRLEAAPETEPQKQRLAAAFTTSSAGWRRIGAIWRRRRSGIASRWRSRRRSATGPGWPTSYHQLGMVAQDRGDLAAAEQWYRKSLEIKEALGNRPGMADSYHQLGMVAQDRGDLAAAEEWYRKSLEIKEALGDRPGMAASYHQLGMVAQDRGDLAAAEAVVSQVAGDRGGARQPARDGHELPPARHGGAASGRSGGGGGRGIASRWRSTRRSATGPGWPPATTSSAW